MNLDIIPRGKLCLLANSAYNGGFAMSIQQNVAQVLREVDALVATQTALHKNMLPSVKVLAVTKNQNTNAIRAALSAGIAAIAENRVQEAMVKYAEIGDSTEWHFIGHLQTNKAKQIVPFCQLIHSLDSTNLALEIDKVARKYNKKQNVLLQINVSGEDSKSGVSPSQVLHMAQFVSSLENIVLCGCMTIAPLCDDPEASRPIFRELFSIFQEVKSMHLPNVNLEWISMGMTNDYPIAIEEGANLIRIGTGIFGNRH
jgi:pyridoxal phosphate enzyme (YggS family)